MLSAVFLAALVTSPSSLPRDSPCVPPCAAISWGNAQQDTPEQISCRGGPDMRQQQQQQAATKPGAPLQLKTIHTRVPGLILLLSLLTTYLVKSPEFSIRF